jgi:5-methylcytosine-specific restriction endonuclease McrA
MREDILRLREQGLTYRQIQTELGCSTSTISYHLSDEQKEKNSIRQKNRRNDAIISKFERFRDRVQTSSALKAVTERAVKFGRISLDEVREIVLVTTHCYLCGLEIDYVDYSSYHFDHIVPTALGGTNTIENLGITHAQCNLMKSGMSLDDFLDRCYDILKHQGRI